MVIYWCDIQSLLCDPERFTRWCEKNNLSPDEFLRPDDAMRHIAGQRLRQLAQETLAPRFISISHSGNLVLCACSQQRIGIDGEELAPAPDIPDGFFTSEERRWIERQSDPTLAFFRLWTRKECYIKAYCRILADMMDIPSLVQNGELVPHIGALNMRDVAILPHQYCVSVAAEEACEAELICIDAEAIFCR